MGLETCEDSLKKITELLNEITQDGAGYFMCRVDLKDKSLFVAHRYNVSILTALMDELLNNTEYAEAYHAACLLKNQREKTENLIGETKGTA